MLHGFRAHLKSIAEEEGGQTRKKMQPHPSIICEKYTLPSPFLFDHVHTTFLITEKGNHAKQSEALRNIMMAPPSPQLIIVYWRAPTADSFHDSLLHAKKFAVSIESERQRSCHKAGAGAGNDAQQLTLLLEDGARFHDNVDPNATRQLEALVCSGGEFDVAALSVTPLLSMTCGEKYLRVWRGADAHAVLLSAKAMRVLATLTSGAFHDQDLLSYLPTVAPIEPVVYVKEHSRWAGEYVVNPFDDVMDVRIRHLFLASDKILFYRLHQLGRVGGLLPHAAMLALLLFSSFAMWLLG